MKGGGRERRWERGRLVIEWKPAAHLTGFEMNWENLGHKWGIFV